MRNKLIAVWIVCAVTRNVGFGLAHAVPHPWVWLLYAALIALDVVAARTIVRFGVHGCLMGLLEHPEHFRELCRIAVAIGGDGHAADEA